MKPFHRFTCFLAVFLLFAAIMPCVSAFTISSVKIDPQGYQAAGTPMTVSFTIDFSSKGNETFPSAGELLMSTNLADARWVPVLVLNGVETNLPSKNGNGLALPGWYVSYPSTEKVQVRGTLTGTMPAGLSTDRNFLKVQEVDSGSAVVSMARVEMPAPPVTTLTTPTEKPATNKPVTKPLTPLPAGTTTRKSSPGTGGGIIAICSAALLVIRRR
jgi:hypothetical protein